jgi:predicted O-methyltransferase YrrM
MDREKASREELRDVLGHAERQRDDWKRLCNEAETQRDEWQALCAETEAQRDRWQRLCNESEEQRNELHEVLERIRNPRDRSRGGMEYELSYSGIRECAEVNAQLAMRERVLLYGLVYSLGARRVLEIGTASGGSARIISAALDDLLMNGKLVTIDPRPELIDFDWTEIAHNSRSVEGRFPQDLKPPSSDARFDFAFVDGDHSFEGLSRDLSHLPAYMEPGSLLLLHDAFNEEVGRAIESVLAGDEYLDCGMIGGALSEPRPGERFGGFRLLRARA